MAKHLEQGSGKHTVKTEVRKTLNFGDAKLPELPKVFPGKRKKKRYSKTYDRVFSLQEMLPVLLAVVLFLAACFAPLAGWPKIAGFGLAALLAAFPLLQRLVGKVLDRKFPDEDLLIVIAVILAFALKEYAAGAMVMILYRASELLEAFVLTAGEGALEPFRDLLPEKARLESDEGPSDTVPESLAVGDVVRVLPKEAFPADGVILQGNTKVDFSPLTGGQDIRTLNPGNDVFAGCFNDSGEVLVRVTRLFEESAMAVRLNHLSAVSKSRTRLEKLIAKAATFYVPAIAVLALVIGVIVPLSGGEWAKWLKRAAVILLLSSPSALVLSVPLAYRGAIQNAAKNGVAIKAQEKIADLARTKTMIFGKTGTVTTGEYTITDVFPDGVEAKDLLSIAAAAESHSQHPIAVALKQAAGWIEAVGASVLEVEELPGRGVSAFIEGRHVYVGNASLLEEHGIWYKVPSRAGAAIHVAVENVYWGHIMVSDKPRENAFDALEELRMQGISNMVMLTGDVLSVSRPIASSLNFDMVKAELSQQGKLSAIDYLQAAKGDRSRLCFVGDGIHDSELMQRADLGIAMNALRAENAMESADFAVLGNDIMTLASLMRVSVSAYRISWINTFFIAAVKLILLILAMTGVLSLLAAAIIELISTGLLMFHALRAYGIRK